MQERVQNKKTLICQILIRFLMEDMMPLNSWFNDSWRQEKANKGTWLKILTPKEIV